MAAGKTTVGKALAAATYRKFVDLDDRIAAMGEPVASLVARDEAEFRRREAAALEQVIAETAQAEHDLDEEYRAQREGRASREFLGDGDARPIVATGGGPTRAASTARTSRTISSIERPVVLTTACARR